MRDAAIEHLGASAGTGTAYPRPCGRALTVSYADARSCSGSDPWSRANACANTRTGGATGDRSRVGCARSGARAAGTIDRTALARFEGELHAEVDVARYQRVVTGVQFIGLAVGGAGVIAIAAGVEGLSDDGRLVAGVLGGTYLVMGTWQAIALLAGESFYERVQREYEQASAGASATTIRVAPSVGPSALGLSLSATF